MQIAHLKFSGMDNWGGASRLIKEIAAARAQGIPVDCDQYPYDAGTNPLRNLLPSWLQEGGIAAMLARLKESDVGQRMRDDIAAHALNNFGKIPSWDAVRVAISTEQPELAGRNLGEVARERRQDPFDAVCDCLLKDRGHTRIIVHRDGAGGRRRHRLDTVDAGRLGRQLARHVRRDEPGSSASALLRHVLAPAQTLHARSFTAHARAGDPQDDRR